MPTPNNLDKVDAFGSGKADFYARVWFNGKEMGKSKTGSTDDGPANWLWSAHTGSKIFNVRIRLMDDDGGRENRDDHVDINPLSRKKDLDLVFNTETGEITGDMTSQRGMLPHASGEGDAMRGQLWFSID